MNNKKNKLIKFPRLRDDLPLSNLLEEFENKAKELGIEKVLILGLTTDGGTYHDSNAKNGECIFMMEQCKFDLFVEIEGDE
jgi:hypothetical protein